MLDTRSARYAGPALAYWECMVTTKQGHTLRAVHTWAQVSGSLRPVCELHITRDGKARTEAWNDASDAASRAASLAHDTWLLDPVGFIAALFASA